MMRLMSSMEYQAIMRESHFSVLSVAGDMALCRGSPSDTPSYSPAAQRRGFAHPAEIGGGAERPGTVRNLFQGNIVYIGQGCGGLVRTISYGLGLAFCVSWSCAVSCRRITGIRFSRATKHHATFGIYSPR